MGVPSSMLLKIVFWSLAGTAVLAQVTTGPSSFQPTDARPSFSPKSASKQTSPTYWPKVHGFLMWASFGVLMPLGIIIIRFSKHLRQDGNKVSNSLHALRYAHIITQILGITLATVGGGIALDKFGSEFRFTHQRLGLALLIAMWLQCFVGLIRPRFGSGPRPFWYSLHWILGTGAAILGFINIFIGMHVYELIFQTSIRTFNVLFSLQLAFFSLAYLLQDRWEYVLMQGRSVKPVAPVTVTTHNGSSVSPRSIP